MNNLKRWFLIGVTSGLVVLLLDGILMIAPALAQGPGWMQRGVGHGGMMGGYGYNNAQPGGYGPGGMRSTQGYTGTTPYGYGPGWMQRGVGPGGMTLAPVLPNGRSAGVGGYGPGWGFQGGEDSGYYGYGCGGTGGGMALAPVLPGGRSAGVGRGGMMWNNNSPFFQTEPLSLSEASEAINTFLTNLNDSNLELGEVMIFDNHAYAEIVEKDSGIGAMEVLVDPASRAVYPEMGPNMMWNLKYGMMAGYGGGYGMMGRFGYNTPGDVSAEMPVTPTEAVEAAQNYLNANFGEKFEADEHVDPFYGYYTLHVKQAGETIGMLSVNGFTKQVFLHTWHGNLVEMSGE
jgi:hypothetical protein